MTEESDRIAAFRRSSFISSLVAIAVTTALGAIVRMFSALPATFPLNDGGLFYQMVLDLRSTWPLLPATSVYNGLEIPFAYPPLGFYVGAGLHDLLGGVDTMRLVPLILSCLTVPALYLLARAIHGGILMPTAAAMAFALMPRSFEWLVMGGGLTRALGVLLAILAAWLTWRLVERPSLYASIAAGTVGGLTALAHPQAAMLALTGGLLFVGARARSRRTVAAVALASIVAGLVVTPWILTVALEHGFDPIVSAGGTQPGLLVGAFNLLSLDFTGSRISPVVGAFAIIGLVLALMQRQWILPAWLGIVMLLDSRGGAVYATVPASLLAGQAIVSLVVAPFWRGPLTTTRPSRFVRSQPVSAALTLFVLLAAATDALGSQVATSWPSVPISEQQREGMDWVSEHGPGDAEYLVVTGKAWAVDAQGEWFPVLAGARSVATVQGTEWLDTGSFYRAVDASHGLSDCASQGDACIESWADDWNVSYSHVYVPKGSVTGPLGPADCCAALRITLADDPAYETTYDGPGATVFARVGDRP